MLQWWCLDNPGIKICTKNDNHGPAMFERHRICRSEGKDTIYLQFVKIQISVGAFVYGHRCRHATLHWVEIDTHIAPPEPAGQPRGTRAAA
jgi:hypothetical protein